MEDLLRGPEESRSNALLAVLLSGDPSDWSFLGATGGLVLTVRISSAPRGPGCPCSKGA